ncbi:unnamed protein product, partial [Rotaria magnacalcarata]
FFHEQSRPDREEYIKVNYENMITGMAHNFEKYNNSIADTLNTPYDYGSVMHYPNNAFSSNSLPTIEPIQPNVTIGQRVNLSAIDIQEVRILYNCSATGITLPLLTTTTATIIYSVNTTVSSVLTVNNPIYDRRGDGNSRCYYDTFDLSVSMAGTYYIRSHSTMDTYGYLYNSSFIPNHPNLNLIASDDDSSGGTQFGFALSLEPRVRYTLVPTTFSNMVTGPYTVIVSGPQRVTLIRTSIVETTPVAPITTDGYQTNPATMIYMINTTVSSELTVNNPIYDRRGDGNSSCYYDTFDLSVSIAGTYRIGSNSAMDTYGYLYNGSFIPNHPNLNLIASNDDSNGGTQFGFALSLQPNAKYTLVATTFSDMATGPYTVIVSGSQRVTLIRTSNVGTTPVAPITTGGYQTNPATMIYMINTTVSSELTVNNPIYDRRGDGNSSCYYDTFDLSVSIAGTYRIGSKSAMDTYGYLYNGSFISNHPNLNLIASDDDSSGGAQFGFALSLQPHAIYTLLVTTFSDFETGPYTVIASGLQRVTLTRTSIVGTTPEAPTTTDGYETYPTIILNIFNTTASSILTSDNPTYMRPGGSNASYYYDTFSLMVPMGGNYDIGTDGALDTFGSLYYGDFIPDHPELNIITYNDDGSEGPPFRLEVVLEAHVRYTLVITTFNQKATGPYTLIVSGLMLVSLTRTTDMAVTQMTRTTTDRYSTAETTNAYMINTTVYSALSLANPRYARPDTSNSTYYYDTFNVKTNITGLYTIASNSAIDTYGFLYNGSFFPNSPTRNLVISDDESGGNAQFRLSVYLQSYAQYVLVVTTYYGNVFGPYMVMTSGLGHVHILRTTATITTQITSTATSVINTKTTTGYVFNTIASSIWTAKNPTYARPHGSNSSRNYHYDTFNVTARIAGLYTIASNSTIDTYGYFYNGSFIQNSPLWNLAAFDDDSAGNGQFRLNVYLESNVAYTLVATTFSDNTTGRYTVIVQGPTRVSIILTTIESVTNTTTPTSKYFYFVTASYTNMLTTNSPTFRRTKDSDLSYFQAIQVTVLTAGTYSFKSDSLLDAYGYLYENNFNPSNPRANLLAEDDDSGGNQQFLMDYPMQYGSGYILVFTTHNPRMTGTFSILTSDPSKVNLKYLHIIPVSSSPAISK